MPDGKALHIRRKIGMNSSKVDEVNSDNIFCMTNHTLCEKVSNIDRIHYFTHSPPAEMNEMSGATHENERVSSRAAYSTHNFEFCAH